ncbi:hypothetical protein ACFYWN_16005 [Streptomyces sp. NPDC002917]|uniref:hypothetical protein n=1 Tax=Streptomyces sp. NPDC002917 TaxID=3364671 RepID=UPI0036BA7559
MLPAHVSERNRRPALVATEAQRTTFRALLDHVERCEACNEQRPCETGAWLRRTRRSAEQGLL